MFIKRIVDYTLQTGGLTTGILTAHWASQGSHSPLLRSMQGKKVSFSHPKLIPATTHSWQILAYILHKCSNELNSYQTWLSDPCTLPLCTVHSTNSKLSGCVFLVAVRVLYLSLSKLVTNPQHGKLASLRKVEKTEFQWNLGWRFFWSLHLGGCQCSSLRDGDGQSFYKFTVLFNHPDLSFEH